MINTKLNNYIVNIVDVRAGTLYWKTTVQLSKLLYAFITFYQSRKQQSLLKKLIKWNISKVVLSIPSYKVPAWIYFTCNPVATSFMSLWDRSRKLSTRSPSMKPSHGSVLTSVVNERQKPWSILPTGLMVWVSLSCSSYRNSNSSLLICVTSPTSNKASKYYLKLPSVFLNYNVNTVIYLPYFRCCSNFFNQKLF